MIPDLSPLTKTFHLYFPPAPLALLTILVDYYARFVSGEIQAFYSSSSGDRSLQTFLSSRRCGL